jgi:2-haloacid dehalogenase
MRRVLAFDVNETLLDLRALDGLFGSAEARERWFNELLRLVFVGLITGREVDFPSASRVALETLGGPDAEDVGAAMRRLPLHADVAPALDRLREGGLTLCALTNSPLESVTEGLRHAGIADRFEAILSAEQAGRLKPAPEPYRYAAETFGVDAHDVTLIACHAWDCAGALAAGCEAAWVRRPGMTPAFAGAEPGIVGDDLGEVADAVLSEGA